MRGRDILRMVSRDSAAYRLRATLLAWVTLCLAACAPPNATTQLSGETMGTTYHLTFAATGRSARQEKQAVESLLESINASMSTYIETSQISRINASTDTAQWHSIDSRFETVFQRSEEIYKDTRGAFNPAVGPLVNAWGFGPLESETTPDSATIQRLLRLVLLENFEFRRDPPAIRKRNADAQLDFSAIAKGYAVDAVAELLEQWGVRDYSVEIGGEVKTRGHHPEGPAWRIAIERPAGESDEPRDVQTVLPLTDAALATSGNYRNYRLEGEQRLGHILDPRTGYPERTSLISVSVLAGDVMTADAYATALMVMGPQEGLSFVESRPDLEAYFIFRSENGLLTVARSSGFPKPSEE